MSKNRRLGDEWLDWEGEEERAEFNESRRTFIILSSVGFLVMLAGLVLLWYFVMPRFREFGTVIYLLSAALFALALLSGILFLLIYILSTTTGRRIPLGKWSERIVYRRMVNGALKIGAFLGISRDRVGSSFIKVSNDLNLAKGVRVEGKSLLVLLPRCLDKETRTEIDELADRYGFEMAIVAGGEAARRKIKELKPAAVLGIACERDLLSGIQDTVLNLPVLGVANRRPEGPCKNTSIDMEELEKILGAICTTG